mgnify:FL=1
MNNYRKTPEEQEATRIDNEWFDQRRERINEMMANNPEAETVREVPRPKKFVDDTVWPCAHKGCDHELTGEERFPGWLCDEHYWRPENRRFRWTKN